jgi:delta 1-pyrroline-5-carboxylate dehydrogenase
MSGNGKALSIADILGADDIEVEAVRCPEWGGTVYVRTIDANARDRFESKFEEKKVAGGVRAALVAEAMCDKEGHLLRPTAIEVEALGAKASGPMDRLFTAVLRINRMSNRDVEELEKNFEATGGDNSG